jgi:hypothetical protein
MKLVQAKPKGVEQIVPVEVYCYRLPRHLNPRHWSTGPGVAFPVLAFDQELLGLNLEPDGVVETVGAGQIRGDQNQLLHRLVTQRHPRPLFQVGFAAALMANTTKDEYSRAVNKALEAGIIHSTAQLATSQFMWLSAGLILAMLPLVYLGYDDHPGIKCAVIAAGLISLAVGPCLKFRG